MSEREREREREKLLLPAVKAPTRGADGEGVSQPVREREKEHGGRKCKTGARRKEKRNKEGQRKLTSDESRQRRFAGGRGATAKGGGGRSRKCKKREM